MKEHKSCEVIKGTGTETELKGRGLTLAVVPHWEETGLEQE